MNNTLVTLKNRINKAFLCDFSDIGSIEPVIKMIVDESGLIDGLVHFVGIGSVRPLKMSKYGLMFKVLNINFFSFVEIVSCLSNKDRYNIDGMNVVGISALGTFLGNLMKTAYYASKGDMNVAVR